MTDRTHVINITPGAFYIAWCSECLRSHAKADVYLMPDGDPTKAFRSGTWNEGHAKEGDDDE